jgi:predicted acyltransferase
MATAEQRRTFWIRIARRVVALIGLGLVVEGSLNLAIWLGSPVLGSASLADIRLPGILQRIGLCYGLAALAIVATGEREAGGRLAIRPRAVLLLIVGLLVGYWALCRFVPVPGFGAGALTPDGSLPAYVDRTVLGVRHLWVMGSASGHPPATYDPEGLLSTVPALTNVLAGVLAGWAWRRCRARSVGPIALAGLGAALLGYALHPWYPLNKPLWTGSFALVSMGFSAGLLALLALWLRVGSLARLLAPFRVLGGNAVLAFLLSQLLGRLAGFPLIPSGGEWQFPAAWMNGLMLRLVGDAKLASLLCALGVLALITLLLLPLHRRAIHFRL